MRVAIVGAGIGGLSAAVGLRRAGARVTVFETSAAVRAGGSGLSVFANGIRALETLGLGPAFASVTDRGVEGFTAGQRRPDGRWIARIPTESIGRLRIVDRADLHRILLDAVDRDTTGPDRVASTAGPDDMGEVSIRCDSEVISARGDGTVVCADGRTERFDLVIGADGIRSRVREAIAPGHPLRYSGYGAWRGITAAPVDLDGQAGETVGRGRRFGIAPLADGRVYWFAVANMPADAVFPGEKSTVEQMFTGWHRPVMDLIEATPAEAIHRTPIWDLGAPLPRCHAGRIVLLGDAAHAMTPNLGQGGGQALEDAATLAVLAGRMGDPARLEHMLDRYDGLRRSRSQDIARTSYLVGRVFQTESRILSGLRNAVLHALPPRLAAGAAASVQDWAPPQC